MPRLYHNPNDFVSFGTFTSKGTWWRSGTSGALQLHASKTTTNFNGLAAAFEQASGNNPEGLLASNAMFITDAMVQNAGLGGTFQLCVPCQGTNLMVYNWALHIWVTVGNGNVVRGTLLDNYVQASGVNQGPWRVGFFDPTINYSLIGPVTLSPVNMFVGDRIVIEMGWTVYNASAGHSVLYAIGSRDGFGTILPDAVAGTPNVGDAASWFEFSSAALLPPLGPAPCVCTSGNPPGTVPSPTGVLPWTPQCTCCGTIDAVTSFTPAEVW